MIDAASASPVALTTDLPDKQPDKPSGDTYVVWNPKDAGISFSLKNDRIIIFQKTYQMLDSPEFLHFLLNPIKRVIAVQTCKMNDAGAKRISRHTRDGNIGIRVKELIEVIYALQGWNTNRTYRIVGEFYPADRLVSFDLTAAHEIVEGRMKRNRVD